MESLGDFATNIHKIDNLHKVDWILLVDDAGGSGSASTGLSTACLRAAECQSRHDGGYTYLETGFSRLWIFMISEYSRDVHIDGSIDLASTYGLTEMSRGTIQAVGDNSDLPSTDSSAIDTGVKRKRSEDVGAIVAYNVQAASQNSSLRASALGPNGSTESFDDQHIRMCLLHAVQMTCIDKLTQSQHYLSLGRGLFCSRQDQQSRNSKASTSHELSSFMPLWSLKSYWHKDGALLMSYNRSNDRYISRLEPSRSYEEIILAPFGWLATTNRRSASGTLSPADNAATHPLGRGSQWRSQCFHILQQYGLEIKGDIHWILLSVLTTETDSARQTIEWPQELCFATIKAICNTNQCVQRAIPSLSSSSTASKDPLDEAGEWLQDWEARNELIKEQLRAKANACDEDDERTQAQEEVPIHLQSRYYDAIDTQILAGIYPTPPEASKSHGNLQSEGSTHMPGSFEDSDAMDVKDDPLTYTTPALDTNVDVGNYDPLKDDDLFADMDDEIDVDNGVTEDDFRFFDEPDELDSPTIETILPDANNHEEATIKLHEPTEELLESPGKLSNGEPTEAIMDDGLEADSVKLSNERKVQIVSSPTIHIFDEISSVSLTLDEKYASKGKFASANNQPPSTSRPNISVEQEKQIPLLQNGSPTSPSSNDTPSSESTQRYGIHHAAEFDQDSVSFLQDATVFDHLFNTCSIFNTNMVLEVDSKHEHNTSTSVSPSMLENQGHGFIQLAQIVADQSMSYNYLLRQYDQGSRDDESLEDSNSINHLETGRRSMDRLLTLKDLASIGISRGTLDAGQHSPVLLPTSMVRVKRGNSIIDLSFAAMEYWKELGMKPLHDAKNVTAFCLCPDTEAYRTGSLSFLQSMSDVYRSLNLGSHYNGDPSLLAYESGLVPVLGLEALAANFKAQHVFCSQFGKSLSSLNNNKNTILIYIIRSIQSNVALMHLCALFQRVFEAYASTIRKHDQPSDLVLQIIPSTLVLSGLEQVLSCSKEYVNISKMVYDRCPLTETASSAYASGPILQLSQSLPSTIEFKLNSDSSTYPLGRPEAFHLAYSYANHSRWLSAAFIDAFGGKQWNASFYLGEYSDFVPALTMIAREILEIVRNAADGRRSYDLFMVKKSEWMHSEIDVWKSLAQEAKIPLFMVVYDSHCPIELSNSPRRLDVTSIEHNLSITPQSPDISSSDASSGKTEEQDHVTQLVDAKHQAWWYPCKEIMTFENGLLVVREHLASGYLVYKNRSLVALYIQDSTHITNIGSLVKTYHDLRILAQARCVDDRLPWHLAVAEAAQSGVEHNMSGNTIA